MSTFEVSGGAGPLVTAAIIAAVMRLDEELREKAAIPPGRPGQGRWVRSSMPRSVEPPFTARPTPAAEGWGVTKADPESRG